MKKTLSELVRETRVNKGISQRELARRAGIDNAEVSRIESGSRVRPGYIILTKISKELDINVVSLFLSAGYDLLELIELGVIKPKISESKHIKNKIEDYSTLMEDGNKIIDIIKVLKGYRSRNLNEAEVIGFLSCCLGIEVEKYILPEYRKKYDL